MHGNRHVRVVSSAAMSGAPAARPITPATARPPRPAGVVFYHPSALSAQSDPVDGGARMLGVVLMASGTGLLGAAVALLLGQSWLVALTAYLLCAMLAPTLCLICMLARSRGQQGGRLYYLDAEGSFHPVPADWMEYCIARPQPPGRHSGLRVPAGGPQPSAD